MISFVDFTELLGVRLTPGQRALARVAFDRIEPRDLPPAEREIARQQLGPVGIIPPAARGVLTIVKGARIGGTYVFGALYSLWRTLVADLSPLAPGEQASSLIVAPDLRLARQALRYDRGALESCPGLGRIGSRTEDTIELIRSDGRTVRIECLPATRGGSALRGRSLVSAVLSEASFFRDESAVVNDVDVFKAVSPRIMAGGMVVLESTPWIEAGLVHDLFSKNFGDPRSCIAAHAPTLLMRDDENTRMIVARERERDPENARREFDAEFMTGGSGLFFGPELLTPAVRRDIDPRLLPPGRTIIGGDFGLVSDATAFVAVRETSMGLVVVDVLELRPKKGAPLKLSATVRRGCEFAAKHGQSEIHVDHHELQAAREHLPEGFRLKPCRGGADAKEDRFLRAREAFRSGRVVIPLPSIRLANQLALIISRPKPGGGTSIVLPRRSGTHLDVASAFILAIDVLTERRGGRMLAALKSLTTPGGQIRLQARISAARGLR